MEKANILKALEKCSRGFDSCAGCPYEGTDSCASVLAGDALGLLKTSETPKAPKYIAVDIFTKKGNMLDYFHSSKVNYKTTEEYNRMLEYYKKEREIQLIAMFRWEPNKVFCKIKCPVSPLPVKGEFEIPSPAVLYRFLNANGWTFKQAIYPRMFE